MGDSSTIFIVDMPPGTGDAQLSLVQATQVDGAVIVTTPQEVSVGDALRGVKMFQRVGVPVLGIVENMSWFECPHCGKPSALFGSGGGERLAKSVELPLLGQVPLYPRVMEGGDTGAPIVVADASSSAARALTGIAERIAELATAEHSHTQYCVLRTRYRDRQTRPQKAGLGLTCSTGYSVQVLGRGKRRWQFAPIQRRSPQRARPEFRELVCQSRYQVPSTRYWELQLTDNVLSPSRIQRGPGHRRDHERVGGAPARLRPAAAHDRARSRCPPSRRRC